MGKRRRYTPPFELEVHSLGKGGSGVGTLADGTEVRVRFAPVGGRVHVVPIGRKRGVLLGRRTALVRPPAAFTAPRCPVFALCGGCAMQELTVAAQRAAKQAQALALAAPALDASTVIHPVRGAEAAYGYRNKVELSFGPRRYLTEEDHLAGHPIEGRFLGFHAPGRWDRVVDAPRCDLVGEVLNTVIAATRAHTLDPDGPPPYDAVSHEGFWRHLVLRLGERTGEVLVVLDTTAPTDAQGEAVVRWGDHISTLALPDGARIAGVVWRVNDGVADVARGEVRRVWERDWITERLGKCSFRLSATSFFQTSTRGAEILYDTVGEALGDAGGTLLDLYCGTGTIGLTLAEGFERVVGIEERAEAIADARANAERNEVAGTEWHVGRVESALHLLGQTSGPRSIVVDPPRSGLHPSVAKDLAGADAEVLVYVACNPGSLGRDGVVLAEGGWRLTDLWTVDLFPQTAHVEVVGRYVRDQR